ncbi:MAG TPA: thiamine pyrophosphate-dependent enzyme [Candidatus Angelobacter sp.]|jgi:pyruvate dehydrogenase E1 component alpha subunit
MPAKKKNRPAATAARRKIKSSRPKPRKRAVKKPKPDVTSLAVLNADKLKELYATMMKCRMLAERVQSIEALSNKPNRSILGFEATMAGAGAHLLSQDCIAMEYGSFAASLIKGTPLGQIFAHNRKQRRDSNENPPMALSMNTVLSLAQKLTGQSAVILMFCPQGQGTLIFNPDIMAEAATKKLPLVCLVESSFESRLEPKIASATGPYIAVDSTFYPVIPVDGGDAVGVFRVAQEAIRRAREGHGPSVIECLTLRGSGSATAGADKSHERYIAHDPLSFMEQYLRKRDLWSDEWAHSTSAAFRSELDAALASSSGKPAFDRYFDNVYSADGWSVSSISDAFLPHATTAQ